MPVMEKMEFSSKSPGFRPEVSARVVESGRSSPEAAELAELLAELGASELLAVEPPQPCQNAAGQRCAEQQREDAGISQFHSSVLLERCRSRAAALQNDTP